MSGGLKRVTVALPGELHAWMKAQAAKEGKTIREVAIQGIREYLALNDPGETGKPAGWR